MKSVAIDANVIVRYLTGDDPVQSPAATELFRAATAGRVNLLIPTPILQETVYVLETYYAGTPDTWMASSGIAPRTPTSAMRYSAPMRAITTAR